MKGFLKCLSFGALFALSLIGYSALSSTAVSAVSEYDNVIDQYSDPKGIDDYYYIQADQLNVKEFTTRTLADYLRGNDQLLNGYNVYIDQGNSSTCDPSDWVNAGNRLVEDKFVSHQGDYYAGGQGRLLNSATFYTYHDVSNLTMSFGATLHAFNNRGVYKGGFIDNGTQDMTRITAVVMGNDIGLYCYNAAANQSFQWQGTNVPQGSAFVLGYLYDSWYPDDTASWNMYFLNHLPPNTQVSYPSGYEGEGLPDFPPIDEGAGQPDVNTWQPKVYMSSMENFKGTFSDQNFFTFDGVPFLCGEFSPQISVEVWTEHGTEDEVLLDSMSTSASSQFTYTFPTAPNTRDYRIVAWYSCPEYIFTADPQFYDFQINSSGSLVGEVPCSAELFCSLNLPTYGLTEVILSPLAFLSQIPSTTCSPLTLPMPNGISNLSLPCMTPIYQQHFGGILLMFQTILTGLFAYYVSLKIFGNIKSLANPRDDQVETVKL